MDSGYLGVWWEVTFGEIHIVGNFVSSLNIWKKFGKVEKDYYKLENLLYERLRFETTVINLKMAQTENPDSFACVEAQG